MLPIDHEMPSSNYNPKYGEGSFVNRRRFIGCISKGNGLEFGGTKIWARKLRLS